MPTYEVTGPAVFPRDQVGKVHAYYTGAVLPDGIPVAELKRLAGRGLICEVAAPAVVAEPGASPAGTGPPPDTAGPVTTDPARVERPAQVAPKTAWMQYAVDRGMSRAEAEAMTKPQLVDAFPAE